MVFVRFYISKVEKSVFGFEDIKDGFRFLFGGNILMVMCFYLF